MPGPINTGFNYVTLATEARRQPPSTMGGPGGDVLEIPGFFQGEQANPHVNPETPPEKPGIETSYVSTTKVFCVWRDWAMCERCQNALGSGHATLPMASGDYTCPHTQLPEYKAVIDKHAKGDAAIVFKEVFSTEGARYAHLEWMEIDPEAARRMQEREKARQKDRVYPPNPEAAFRKD